ncbi:MAG: Gfo/Idh/MocA family oxidoreductase [Planctomycetota bacterium]|nr:Gfo/Idh/MocA family oxidoreductase [Planctomycetota bacterium]
MAAFKPFKETRKLRILQVGCGGMAQGWVERTQKRADAEIVGLVDIRRQAAEETAAKHGLPPGIVFSTLEEALEKAKPDAVTDITVPEAHFGVTTTALKAGCHVLGEKPLADSMVHAKEMCKAAKKAKRLYMVTQNRRYMGTIQAFSKAVKDGVIGEVSSLDADFFIGAHFGGFRDVMDHVLLLDMAIHTFDQARFISGCDPVAVYCYEYNPHGSWYKGSAAALCVFEMTKGVVFTYRGSWAAEGFNTSWESNWRAVGSKGTVVWDGAAQPKCQRPAGTEGFFRKLEDVTLPEITVAHGGHEGVLEEFLQCVRKGATPQTVCDDNTKSLAMCFAAIQSAETGKRVKVK